MNSRQLLSPTQKSPGGTFGSKKVRGLDISPRLPSWSEVRPIGRPIPARSYQAGCLYGTSLYVYGGYDFAIGHLKDFQMIDLKNPNEWKWKKVPEICDDGKHPGLRSRQAVAIHDNKFYMFGGLKTATESTNDMWYYDFTSTKWVQPVPDRDFQPPPLDSHTMNVWASGQEAAKFVVYGGFRGGDSGSYSNAMYIYHVEANKWEIAEPEKKSSAQPAPRAGHAAAIVGNTLYIFGGYNTSKGKLGDFWSCNLTTLQWTNIPSQENTPTTRSGHSLTVFNDYLILFGGIHDLMQERNDVVLFDIKQSKWRELDIDSLAENLDFSDAMSSRSRVKGLALTPRTRLPASPRVIGPELFIQAQSPKRSPKHSHRSSLDTYSHINLSPRTNATKALVVSGAVLKGKQSLNSSKLSNDNNIMRSALFDQAEAEQLMKKQNMLKELEVPEEEKQFMRQTTPLTSTMAQSLKVLGAITDKRNSNRGEGFQKDEIVIAHLTSTYGRHPTNERLVHSKKPCIRDGHTALIMDGKLVVFGGQRHTMSLNDIFFFELAKQAEETPAAISLNY